jgi:hypothetical protein
MAALPEAGETRHAMNCGDTTMVQLESVLEACRQVNDFRRPYRPTVSLIRAAWKRHAGLAPYALGARVGTSRLVMDPIRGFTSRTAQ